MTTINDNPKPAAFADQSDFGGRLAVLLSASVLTLAGVLFTLSVTAALFGWAFINTAPGEFLVHAYGILAYMIPAALFWAAWILFDPVFKPGRIFVLAASLVPFLTLSSGLFFIREFERHGRESSVLRALGGSGFGFAVIGLTTLECLAIAILHACFFGKKKVSRPVNAPPLENHDTPENGGVPADVQAASVSGSPLVPAEPAKVPPVSILRGAIKLPGLKPLSSSAALRDLEQFGYFTQTEQEGEAPASYDVIEEKFEHEINNIVKTASLLRNLAGLHAKSADVSTEQARQIPETVDTTGTSETVNNNGIGANEDSGTDMDNSSPVLHRVNITEEEFKALTEEPDVFEENEEVNRQIIDEVEEIEGGGLQETEGKIEEGENETETEEIDKINESETEELDKAFGDVETFETVTVPVSLLTPYSRLVEDEERTAPPEEEDAAITDAAVENDAGQEMSFREISAGSAAESAAESATGSEAVPDYAPVPEMQETETAAFAVSATGKSVANKPIAPKPRKSWAGKHYHIPVEGILNQYPDGQYWIIDETTQQAARILQETLKEFNIEAEVTGIRKGPVITMFEILPAPGVKLSKIVNLQDNIALRLAASSVRIVAPIPGKHAVGIEVPNKRRNIVSFREIIEGELRREGKRPEIPMVLGKDITGEAVTVDLAQTPHLLIAGSTGSGKSVCVNSMILSILYQRPPADCRLILIDPKIVELKLYNDIPHLLTPVITEPKRAFQALQYCIYEMERRYACLDSMGVRDIKSYNRRIRERSIAAEHMPYIVVVIDEFADLMATTGKELESTVARLAAMSRAVGIHLVLATQRPSIDVITGLIKANIPSRIAFMVASKMDSRIIIDMVGAEKLLGKGDMLYAGVVDPFPIRMQGAFVSEEEIERVVDYVKSLGEPEYIDDEIFYDEDEEDLSASVFGEGDDPLYDKALEVVYQTGKASASYIQRRLKIGYNRAARLVEEMEHRGVVGPAQGSRPREILRSA
jgi:S-DNA-T family DNA segregation ATPase FtsK/SpoIIIE